MIFLWIHTLHFPTFLADRRRQLPCDKPCQLFSLLAYRYHHRHTLKSLYSLLSWRTIDKSTIALHIWDKIEKKKKNMFHHKLRIKIIAMFTEVF